MKISVPRTVLVQKLDDEIVILELSAGRYYGLDRVASSMWAHLIEQQSIDGAAEKLVSEYEVDRDELTRDLRQLVVALVEKRLLVVEE